MKTKKIKKYFHDQFGGKRIEVKCTDKNCISASIYCKFHPKKIIKKFAGWTLDELLAERKTASENGWCGNLQSTNAMIARFAKKYKIDYYSIDSIK